MTVFGETIAAIATAPGRAGVAVVRVSGPDAFAVAERLTGRPVIPGRISCRTITEKGAVLDQAVVLSFKAPHSYTGEDVVEIQCHGGFVTPKRILEAAIGAGARLARRGEFTERAFLNGKLGYEQAESVLDLIDAKTDRAADAALAGLNGRRTNAIRSLYDRAISASVEIEHSLDVSEDELPESFFTLLSASLKALKAELHSILVSAKEGRILREGALVVLAGPPNVGKSSLMNALLRENRAIVSEIPGTTRDTIEEWLDLEGWPIRLVDTAGLRETTDPIEREGVARTRHLLNQADVILLLEEAPAKITATPGVDTASGSTTLTVNELARVEVFPLEKTLIVQTKIDLINLSQTEAKGSVPMPFNQGVCPHAASTKGSVPMLGSVPPSAKGSVPILAVSAKTGEGLELLKKAIVERLEMLADESGKKYCKSVDLKAFDRMGTDPADFDPADLMGTDPSDKSFASLLEVAALLDPLPDVSEETDLVLLGNALRRIAERLGETIGATYSSDILDRLFSRFCIGK